MPEPITVTVWIVLLMVPGIFGSIQHPTKEACIEALADAPYGTSPVCIEVTTLVQQPAEGKP